MILVHGRGASAENMLSLADVLAQPDFAYLAPQAARNTWYPHSFLAPLLTRMAPELPVEAAPLCRDTAPEEPEVLPPSSVPSTFTSGRDTIATSR